MRMNKIETFMYLDGKKKTCFSSSTCVNDDDSSKLYNVMTYGKHKNAFVDLYQQFMTQQS